MDVYKRVDLCFQLNEVLEVRTYLATTRRPLMKEF
jgi:hypothetical protein